MPKPIAWGRRRKTVLEPSLIHPKCLPECVVPQEDAVVVVRPLVTRIRILKDDHLAAQEQVPQGAICSRQPALAAGPMSARSRRSATCPTTLRVAALTKSRQGAHHR
jgi:hypothetical protein